MIGFLRNTLLAIQFKEERFWHISRVHALLSLVVQVLVVWLANSTADFGLAILCVYSFCLFMDRNKRSNFLFPRVLIGMAAILPAALLMEAVFNSDQFFVYFILSYSVTFWIVEINRSPAPSAAIQDEFELSLFDSKVDSIPGLIDVSKSIMDLSDDALRALRGSQAVEMEFGAVIGVYMGSDIYEWVKTRNGNVYHFDCVIPYGRPYTESLIRTLIITPGLLYRQAP